MMPASSALLVLTDGPVPDVGLPLPRDAPRSWRPQTVIWVTRDAADRTVLLGPDKELLNLVGHRIVGGGLSWVPYRLLDEPALKTSRGDVWRYAWDRVQDPAEQKAERDRVRGLRAVAG